jgi:hypothetical protein
VDLRPIPFATEFGGPLFADIELCGLASPAFVGHRCILVLLPCFGAEGEGEGVGTRAHVDA